MASQEVSKPVMIGVIVAAIVIIGFLGWYFFLRTPAPATGTIGGGPPGMGGQGMPGYPGGPPGAPNAAPAPR